jgi:hypothetical protein
VPGHSPEEIEAAPAPAWLLAALRDARPAGRNGRHATTTTLAEGEVIVEGTRDNTLASLAGTMRRRGMAPESIAAALLVENEQRCEPPLPDEQVRKIARSVGSYPPGPSSPNGTPAVAQERRPAATIILDHVRTVYQPAHRRGGAVWSAVLAAEVRRGEALARCADIALMDALTAGALEMPRDEEGRGKRSAAPRLYREWAPVAWAELLAQTPDEPEAPAVETTAEADFRRLAGALTRLATLGRHGESARRPGRGHDHDDTDRECRSILHWCMLFARPGAWAQVRSYYVWCRQEGDTGDRHASLRVAIRPDLLGQLGLRDLAEMGQRRLADLCAHYGLGRRVRVGHGGAWAIELAPSWLAELLAAPTSDGPGVGVTGEATHARPRGACDTATPEELSP